ncbi:MAG TPA: substrate-binding and VWA domain-containing protein [Candidatus Olsenella pullicola]|nr:substrate-binding and VWA domain-containing protein [Candidatus Olsenella pullicola]
MTAVVAHSRSRALAVLLALVCALVCAVALPACSRDEAAEPAPDDAREQPATNPDPSSDPEADPDVVGTTLRVLAGSEIKDMLPILEDAQAELGITVELTYQGTLDGTETVMAGEGDFDATWFPSNAYMTLFDEKSALVSEEASIMRTPVVLGVKRDRAAELGWDEKSPTWAEVVDAAASGEFAYGMSSPVSSNSGFSALVELATAISGTGAAITAADVDVVASDLTRFAQGQALTSGSSGWLMEAYDKDSSAVDGVFNYESLILQDPDLVEVIPQDGVITADYPLTLLSGRGEKVEAAYGALVDYLRRDDVQQRIAEETFRRTDATTPDDERMVFEIPFPNRIATVRALLLSWVAEVRKPANMVFQIDTSGSMGGARLDALKAALLSLTETGADGTAALLTFQPRETIRFVEFASDIKSEKNLVVGEDGNLVGVSSYVSGLSAVGGTALYGTLQHALELAAQTRADDNVTSVVLFSDGENTDAPGIEGFAQWYEANETVQGIPVYAILFGEASGAEMERLAELTGGRVFDAGDGDLTAAFKEIRGYL